MSSFLKTYSEAWRESSTTIRNSSGVGIRISRQLRDSSRRYGQETQHYKTLHDLLINKNITEYRKEVPSRWCCHTLLLKEPVHYWYEIHMSQVTYIGPTHKSRRSLPRRLNALVTQQLVSFSPPAYQTLHTFHRLNLDGSWDLGVYMHLEEHIVPRDQSMDGWGWDGYHPFH